jgi:predicted extracellular nuclease
MRRARLLVLLTLGVVVSALVASAPQAVSNTVVISQVYGGGGNAGATYTHDFVELFNRGSTTASLSGWSIQYTSATGTGNFGGSSTQITELPNVSLAPGQYLLVQEASQAAVGSPLPTPDVIDATPIAMAAGAGKVALTSTTNPLGCNGGSTPCNPSQLAQIIDLVGYGNANFFEGAAAAPTLSNTTAALRGDDGCTETDDNSADFTSSPPTPRNTASPLNPCGGPTNPSGTGTASPASVQAGEQSLLSVAVTPGTNPTSTGLAVTADLTPIGGPPSQPLLDDGTNGDVTPGDNAFSYLATVAAGTSPGAKTLPFAITDAEARSGAGSIALTVSASCGETFTPIPEIQGSGPAAAITGTVTTEGVVVGDFEGGSGLMGFYLQDVEGDGDPATSDGIFVFTGTASTVSAGQLLRVTGFARERFGQTALNGANTNTSPVTDIVACGTDSVEPAEVTMPFADLGYPERFEGMLVELPQALVISEYFNYERFGEMVLALPLPGETRAFTPTAIVEPGAPAQARALANALSRITLDDGLGIQNPDSVRHPNGGNFALDNRFRGGDTVQNTLGVLGFDFNLYRIQPTGPAAYTAVNLRPEAPEPVGGDVHVAAMNTLNFFLTLDYASGDPLDNKCGPLQNVECRGADADQPLELTRQRDKLIAALAGLNADVIGLNEIENTSGVDPLTDPDGIVPGLNDELGAGTYEAIDTGTIGTDAIKVGLIYKPAEVTPVGSFQILDSTDDPRFIDTLSRPVLAQTFEVNATSATFTVAVNHLKSKGSACAGDPDTGDGQGNCNLTRRAAAQALVDWLATDPTGSGDPDFLIMGDLNSYAQEDPIDAIKAGPDDLAGTPDDYLNLIAEYQGTHAYSFVFDGQAGYLDHALASPQLVGQVTGATEWHINADEPDLLDYDTSFKPPAQEAIYEPNEYRASDHDPVVVGLDLCEETPPTISVAASPSSLWPPNHRYRRVTATVTAADNSGVAPTVTFVSATSNEPDNAPGSADGNTVNDIVIRGDRTFDLRAERNENGTGRVYTLRYRATDACGNTAVGSATVTVPISR